MLGKQLGGRYRIVGMLGAGGFGQTYVAEDTLRPGHPTCVVKQLKPARQDEAFLQVARRLFKTEAETLERLGNHPQIPRLLAYFEENQEFYLVQEFIAGKSLTEEISDGQQMSEEQVVQLFQELLDLLVYVHSEGVIHRDIKPSNLIRRTSDGKLVLIDFGAVKEIHGQIASLPENGELTVGIGTQGYMTHEQIAGRPQFSSDIYAVGMIGVKALTGRSPIKLPIDVQTGEILWREAAPPVSEAFAALLTKMVRYSFTERYQSAAAVLQDLYTLQHEALEMTLPPVTQIPPEGSASMLLAQQGRGRPSWRVVTGVGATAIATVVALIALKNWGPSLAPLDLPQVANTSLQEVSSQISFGDRILTPGPANLRKQEGVDRIAAGNYDQAVQALEAARREAPDDPETLIYLNNARIGNKNAYAIAAVVPLGDTPFSALEMLRGIAQVQDQVNQAGGINGTPLKVAIANDNSQPGLAQQVARALVSRPEILAVIGHGGSDASLAAGPIYQNGRLPMITPISSAVQISELGNYIFRTMPSDRLMARALSSYLTDRLGKNRVALFYNASSAYSKSITDEFKNALFYRTDSKIVAEYDLSSPVFNAYDNVEEAIAQGAEAIFIASHSGVSDRALQVIQLNQRRLPILAGDSIYTPKTLQVGAENAVGMVIAIPADAVLSNTSNAFKAQATQTWGGLKEITWRSAMAHDAAQAILVSLEQDSSRRGIQRSLSNPDFSVAGATGSLRFTESGDRDGGVQLVTVASIEEPGGFQYRYQLLPASQPAPKPTPSPQSPEAPPR